MRYRKDCIYSEKKKSDGIIKIIIIHAFILLNAKSRENSMAAFVFHEIRKSIFFFYALCGKKKNEHFFRVSVFFFFFYVYSGFINLDRVRPLKTTNKIIIIIIIGRMEWDGDTIV